MLALGQSHHLLHQRMRLLQLTPRHIQRPQSPQYLEELRGLPHLPTQLLRSGKGLFHPTFKDSD